MNKTANYQITITALGPVHIGTGRIIDKRDYFTSNNTISIIDPSKFISQLSKEQLDAYCNFLELDSRNGLDIFLEKNNLNGVAKSSQAYQLEAKLSKTRSGIRQALDIFEFIKDPYGCPYIPGTSFKGVLRTVLLSAIISEKRSSFDCAYPSGTDWRKSKRAGKAIESAAFEQEHPDPSDLSIVNDIMKYISVSDSAPLDTSCLALAKKYDKFSINDRADHKRRMGNQSIGDITDGNELNIYRECLKPGTVISMQLSIDSRINSYLPFSLDKSRLETIFRQFQERYHNCFFKHFELENSEPTDNTGKCRYIAQAGPLKGMRCPNSAVGETGYCNKHANHATESGSSDIVCYLGGGVDFNSKTVLNALFTNESERINEISRILYDQFPSKIDDRYANRKHAALNAEITEAGFSPCKMQAKTRGGSHLIKAKDDHRHWMDQELGVSPHTLKLGKISSKLLPMGRCKIDFSILTNTQ